MACVRKGRGKWVADFADPRGIRRWITRDTKRAAPKKRLPLCVSRSTGRGEDLAGGELHAVPIWSL
jgi:hypothetical protein